MLRTRAWGTARGLCLCLWAAWLVVLAACASPSRGPGPEVLTGRIAWPKEGDLWVANLPGPHVHKIASVPAGGVVTSVAWSPDGSQVVYSQVSRRPGEAATGADLMVANADGSGVRTLVARDQPGTVLDMPQWLPSGRIYYTQLQISPNEQRLAVLRTTDGQSSELVLEGGYASAVSPDESTIVYLVDTHAGPTLRNASLAASATPPCELLSATRFYALGPPRLSPDGLRIALPASGDGASVPGAEGCGGNTSASNQPAAALPPSAPDLLALLGLAPATAWAHGLPYAVWTMDIHGGHLQRVVSLNDDDPRITWSPGRLAAGGLQPGLAVCRQCQWRRSSEVSGSRRLWGLDWAR